MEILVYFIIIAAVFVLNAANKGKKQAKERQANNYGASTHRIDKGRVTPTAVGKGSAHSHRQTAARTAGNLANRAKGAAREWKKSIYEADRDTHYDRESLDYCDSDVPSSEGITFRGIPQGGDELAYLMAFNRKREKLLEKSLESRG